ncbi:MAG TPA: cytosine permease, partial [Terrimesophilobacter sp.]|nr:cytosine permease [Terrimesophilobacter sp.]
MSSVFDQFIAEAGLAEEVVEVGVESTDASQFDTGEAFPLSVYDPGEEVPETIDLESPRAFRVELAGVEPSPIEQRVGRSTRLFWIWFAANSSVISVGLGAVIFSLGVSLRQAIIATLVGVSISSLPLGIGALAGKRSGQPTMVVSRATFGLMGNILPALLAFLTRVFWGAVLLWLFTLGLAAVNDSTGLLDLDGATLSYATLGAGVLLTGVIAFFGYGLIARVQAVLTIVSSVLVVGFIMLSWPTVDLRAAMRVADGDWTLVATGAVLVFSVVGLVWAMSSADVARYQYPHSSGAGSMLWSWAGAALPAFLLVGYGSLLAASDPELLTGLLEEPMETLTVLIPAVYVYPMLAVLGLGLLSGAVVTIYSGGFALQAVGLRAPRSIVVIVVAVLTGAAAAGVLVAVTGFDGLVRDLATTIAVPVAAWVGVFSAELMMRSRRFHSPSLVQRGGVYADVRWLNLATLIVATVVGFAFTDAAVSWLSWQGFGWGLVGFEPDSVMAGTDIGVVGALVLALLVTVAAGKPGITMMSFQDVAAG